MVIFRTPLDPLKVEGERKKDNKKKINVSEVGMERKCNMNFTIPAVSLLQPEASLILLDIFILLISRFVIQVAYLLVIFNYTLWFKVWNHEN